MKLFDTERKDKFFTVFRRVCSVRESDYFGRMKGTIDYYLQCRNGNHYHQVKSRGLVKVTFSYSFLG